jgi:cysteine desulfurase / selenocysteine lyase
MKPTPQNIDPIEKFRAAYVQGGELIHLNNAGHAPLSKPAHDTAVHWLDRLQKEGAHAAYVLPQAMEKGRANLAKFINVPADQLAFFPGAANAISQVAFGLKFKVGDEILTWDQEYPSNFYPWRDAAAKVGAKLIVMKSGDDLSTPMEIIAKHVTPRTRLIATSWVQYQTGAIIDLEQLTSFARERGILTFADGIQGIGQLPFDFEKSGLDFIVGGSHKWMTSPLGVGFLAARKERFETLEPSAVGCISYGTPADLSDLNAKMRTGPARFEPGGRAMIEMAALGASVELFMEVGIGRIAQEAEFLAKRLMHGLRERGYQVLMPNGKDQRGGIVTFRATDKAKRTTPKEIEDSLSKEKVSFATRAGGVRLSPHAFNSLEDIERVLKVL